MSDPARSSSVIGKTCIRGAALAVLFGALAFWPASLFCGDPTAVPIETFTSRPSFDAAWKIKKWKGIVGMEFLKDGDRPFLSLTCDRSSWAFVHKADVDLAATPMLTWSWKSCPREATAG
jgi:hypothetical protein